MQQKNTPHRDDLPIKRRGGGEKGVYWTGRGWAYDDGLPAEKYTPPHKVYDGVHPRVKEQMDRAETSRLRNDELERLRKERAAVQKERAILSEKLKAMESASRN